MKLFGQIIRTAVNVAVLPVTVVKDVITVIADAADGEIAPATKAQLEKIKEDASESAE